MRLFARACLLLLLAAALVGAYLPRIRIVDPGPLQHTHHPHLLVFIAFTILYVAVVLSALLALGALVAWLWKRADL